MCFAFSHQIRSRKSVKFKWVWRNCCYLNFFDSRPWGWPFLRVKGAPCFQPLSVFSLFILRFAAVEKRQRKSELWTWRTQEKKLSTGENLFQRGFQWTRKTHLIRRCLLTFEEWNLTRVFTWLNPIRIQIWLNVTDSILDQISR